MAIKKPEIMEDPCINIKPKIVFDVQLNFFLQYALHSSILILNAKVITCKISPKRSISSLTFSIQADR